MPTKKPSCIVIGAGLSGLAAAWSLVQRGFKVDVVEAYPWIGGRVYTYRFKEAPDLNCELGGEWIGEDHDRMRALCRQFKLTKQLLPHRFAYSFPKLGKAAPFIPAGKWPFGKPLQRKFTKFLRSSKNLGECDGKELDRLDWWTRLKMMGFSDE